MTDELEDTIPRLREFCWIHMGQKWTDRAPVLVMVKFLLDYVDVMEKTDGIYHSTQHNESI